MKPNGFTLLELMVSVSIAVIALGGIIVNYNGYNNTQVLKQAALTLKNNFRFAQTKALSGEKPSSNCTELVGWTISFAAGSYSIRALCTPEGLQGQSVNVTLPTDISFSPIPGGITFRVVSRGTTLTSTATISLVGYSQTYRIQVSPSGDISDVGLQ